MEKYIIIAVVFLIVLFAVLKSMKKDAHLEVNKLIDYLGGMDNIVDKQVNLSRFIVTLRDISLANKEEIQKLGARGIVEIDNQLKIILGPGSKQLRKYIDEIKKM
jgi:PTS system D-glucosamine-specific IIC component